MTLKQIYALADSRSHFVRTAKPDIIWSAITEAARSLYFWIKKENKGFFIKWDTTTIAFANAQEEYTCPPDLEQIVRFSERQNSSQSWRQLTPSGVNDPLFKASQFEDVIILSGIVFSDYAYAGPYLTGPSEQTGQEAIDEAAEQAEVYKVRIAPIPSSVRQTELIYTAKFLEMTEDTDVCIIPEEGRGVLLEYAIANLLRGKSDEEAVAIKASGDEMRELYLTSVRDRQIQEYAIVQPYLDDLS